MLAVCGGMGILRGSFGEVCSLKQGLNGKTYYSKVYLGLTRTLEREGSLACIARVSRQKSALNDSVTKVSTAVLLDPHQSSTSDVDCPRLQQ